MSRTWLLDRFEQRWSDLLGSYAGLSAAEMSSPGVVGRWSVKDIVAHVSAWEEESLKHVPVILAGKRPPRYSVTYGGIDAFNAFTTERDRGLPLAEVLRRRDATHRRLLALVGGLPEASLAGETRVRRRLRLDAYGHYPTHARAIRRWRAGLGRVPLAPVAANDTGEGRAGNRRVELVKRQRPLFPCGTRGR